MSTFKKAKVVMLPTKQKATIGDLGLSTNVLNFAKNNDWINIYNPIKQYLYIISDKKPDNGDYYIIDGISEVLKNNGLKFIDDNCKKIIATTDASLLIDTYINQGDTVKGDLIIKRGSDYTTGLKGRINLPQPSKQFIQKYIEEYNKGNIITDVLVEYEEIIYNPEKEREYKSNDRIYIEDCDKQTRLKINYNDNTITVKKVKDSYTREEVDRMLDEQASRTTAEMLEKFKGYKSREEVIELCKQAFIDDTYAGGFGPNEKTIDIETEKWIKENL